MNGIENKIPKQIIYAWFGGGQKTRLIEKCIDSWKRIIPDYKIIELNEKNCNIERYNYSKKAYEEKKWAFVSDCMKLDYLYENGGIVFDADIEVLKPFSDEILNNRAFTSKESAGRWISAVWGAEIHHPWIKSILKYYKQNEFIYDPARICNTTIIHNINQKWYKKTEGNIIYLHEDVTIYPSDYFECKNWANGLIETTKNSYTIHHYTASWLK